MFNKLRKYNKKYLEQTTTIKSKFNPELQEVKKP